MKIARNGNYECHEKLNDFNRKLNIKKDLKGITEEITELRTTKNQMQMEVERLQEKLGETLSVGDF